nr:LLM class flavin-dependent oxidoreductase [Amycolatopsis niigatensis]
MVQQRVGEQLRFGVFLVSGRFPGQDDAAVLRRTVRAARAAEAAGFDDVWLAEHHFMPYGVCPSGHYARRACARPDVANQRGHGGERVVHDASGGAG